MESQGMRFERRVFVDEQLFLLPEAVYWNLKLRMRQNDALA
jgi:hypothetical protein